MLVTVHMSGKEELFLAIGAIVILAMSVFGLDSIIFRKKRAARPVSEFPKQRIHYIVEDAQEDTEAEVRDRSRR
jgi:hypothetical protein